MIKNWSDLEPSKSVRVKLAAVTPPVISTISEHEDYFTTVRKGNLYQTLDAMIQKDPELSGVINGIGYMCAKYYDSVVYATPEGVFKNPVELDDDKQKLLLEEAQHFASADHGFDFRSKMFSIGKTIMKHGDMVIHLVYKSNKGITELQPLPRKNLTALENLSQKQQSDAQIYKANWFLLNEGSGEHEKEFKADTCLKISYDAFADEVYDLQRRFTYGVWSVPPILCLKGTIHWKLNTILNDILWRSRSVPREHHKLNLSQFTPDKYSGTWAERIAKAQTDAVAAVHAYIATLAPSEKTIEADQIYVTDADTEITYVEPQSTTYHAPNELIGQQNKSIYMATGFPGVEEKSYAAAYLSNSMGLMRAEVIAEKVKEALEKLLRKHLGLRFGTVYDDEELGKIQISTKLILERDRSELARQLALFDSTEAFTDDEIRAWAGKGPLSAAQRESIDERKARRSRDTKESVGEVARDVQRAPAKVPGYEKK